MYNVHGGQGPDALRIGDPRVVHQEFFLEEAGRIQL